MDTPQNPNDVTYDQVGNCLFEQWPMTATPFELPDPRLIQGAVMFDTETSGLHPDDGARVSVVSLAFPLNQESSEVSESTSDSLIQGKPQGDLRRYVSAAFPFGQGPEDDHHALSKEHWDYLLHWLDTAGGGLVGHNIKFDLIQMNGKSVHGFPGRDLTDRALYDTMVGQFELTPTHSVALKKIAARMWGEDADSEQRALQPHLGPKSNPRFDRVPWEVMFPYARRDAELTAALFEHQIDVFDESSAAGGFVSLEMNVVRALTRMELAGLPYAVEESRSAAKQLEQSMDDIREQLPFKPTPIGSRKYFFNSPDDPLEPGLGLQPLELTATGNPSTSASVVERLALQGIEHADDLLTYNRYSSAVSKWYVPFADRAGCDSRIRTSLRHVAGTKSGRLSSTRVNLQAVPKDYALHLPVPTPRQLIAQAVQEQYPGWGLYETDLMQAELRVAALYADVTPMLDALANGRDVHSETATQLFGAGPDHPDWGVYRSLAKRALPLDAPVLTPRGFRPMGDIQVGDTVVGPDGAPTQVLDIPFEGEGEIWEVRTRSGAVAFCDADHLWTVRKRYGKGYETITTRQLAEEVASNRRRRPSLPPFLDENTPDRDFPVHPYVLGALLGDGSVPASGQGTPKLHSLKSDRYIADRCGELSGDTVREATKRGMPEMGRYHFLGNRVKTGFRKLGILGVRGKDKRVPEEYFHGSAEQRLELLRGLMDTDGCASNKNRNVFNNTSRGLVDAVVRLVRSLGGVATINEAYRPPHGKWSPAWFVHIRMPEGRNPYSLPRKSELWRPNRIVDTVMHVAPTGRREPVKCITVDRPDGLFVTNDYLVTHNSNFSLIFGAGPKTFHESLVKSGNPMPFRDVQRLVYNWRDLYPQFGAAIQQHMEFCDTYGYVEGVMGRRRYYSRDEDTHSAFNQLVQSSLALFAKQWTVQTDQYMRSLGHPHRGQRAGVGRSGLLLTIHDSQVLLLPEDEGESIMSRVDNECAKLWDQYFPGVSGGSEFERWD